MIVETGPNGSTSWIGRRSPGVVGAKEDRLDESALAFDRRGVRVTRYDPGRLLELGHRLADGMKLVAAGERAHGNAFLARVADADLGEPGGDRLLDGIDMLGRRHGAADGGAFLPRLNRHLPDDFLHEQVEFGRSRGCVGAQDRGVEAVAFGDEAHALPGDHRVRLKFYRGLRRAGEGNHVLKRQMLEQVAGRAHDQLQRAGRQYVGFDHDADGMLGEIAGGRRRLYHRGHPGEDGGAKLLQHAPDGEIEGVDVNRDALQRREDVLADEGAALRQRLHVAVDQDALVGEFAASLRGKGKKRAGAALDIDPAVGPRRAGLVVELVQLFLARHDRLAERLQHVRPLVERHPAERRAADSACVVEHRLEVEPAAAGQRDRLPGDRALHLGHAARCLVPAVMRVIEEVNRLHARSSTNRRVERSRDTLLNFARTGGAISPQSSASAFP
jgi:hypothetical protein